MPPILNFFLYWNFKGAFYVISWKLFSSVSLKWLPYVGFCLFVTLDFWHYWFHDTALFTRPKLKIFKKGFISSKVLTPCRRSHSRIRRRSKPALVENGKPSLAPKACFPSLWFTIALVFECGGSLTANTSKSFLGNFPTDYFGISVLPLNVSWILCLWRAQCRCHLGNTCGSLARKPPKYFQGDPEWLDITFSHFSLICNLPLICKKCKT